MGTTKYKYTDQVMEVINNPKYNLKEKYSVLNNLSKSTTVKTGSILELDNKALAIGPQATVYYKNLKQLGDLSVVKTNDPRDNEYITDVFRNFSLFMFYQHGVGYSPQLGLFVAGGLNGQIATSSNGIDWNTTAVTGSWRRFAWSPTLNLFIGTRIGSTIAYSSDGGTWTASNSGSGNWWDAVWNEEYQRFFVTRISSQTRPVWTSTDGINWTQQITTLTSGTWVGLGFRKEIT
jgi:hypothetical protein